MQRGWVNCAGVTWGQMHSDYWLNWSQRLSPLTFQISDSLMLPLPLSHCISLKRSWSIPRLLTEKDLCGKVKEAGGGDRQFMGREKKELEKSRNRKNIRGNCIFPYSWVGYSWHFCHCEVLCEVIYWLTSYSNHLRWHLRAGKHFVILSLIMQCSITKQWWNESI